MAEVKIEIIDKKSVKEEYGKEQETYYGMLKALTNRLFNIGIDVFIKSEGGRRSLLHILLQPKNPKDKIPVELLAFSAEANSPLEYIRIEVYDERAFNVVSEITRDYKDRYHNLKKISIEKYF